MTSTPTTRFYLRQLRQVLTDINVEASTERNTANESQIHAAEIARLTRRAEMLIGLLEQS